MKIFDNLANKLMQNKTIQKMVENRVIAFLVETINRFLSKNPTYWKWIQVISLVIACITGAPHWLITHGFTIPSWLTVFESASASEMAIAVTIIGQLPTQSPTIANDSSGIPIKQTNQITMPFTAAKENSTPVVTI